MTTAETAENEYTDEQWLNAVKEINEADREVLELRTQLQSLQARYGAALTRRLNAQTVRDNMIVTDPRTPAEVGRHAGVGRSRCSQIRTAARIANERTETANTDGVIL